MLDYQNEEYLSGEVQEILGQPPRVWLTWGTMSVICGVAILTMTGFFLKYPDTVKGDLILTTVEPPVTVVSQKTGYLAEIRVKEGDEVKKSDILAVFATNADVRDVLVLEKEVDELSEFNLVSLRSYRPNTNLKVGEIAPAFAGFVSVFDFLPLSEGENTDLASVNALNSHIRQTQISIQTMESQKRAKESDIAAARREFETARYVYEKTTDEKDAPDIFKANANVSTKIAEKENLNADIEKRKEDILNAKAKILELQLQQESGSKDKIFKLKQALSFLKSEIRRWKDEFLVVAPADGKVTFYTDLSGKQFKKAGDELMAIVPASAEDGEFIGQVKLPAKGSGKVLKGQQVSIKFDRYPHREFGYVTGKVSKIYALPVGDAYFVEVTLENGLITNLDRKLEFQQKLSARAEIATAERTIIGRIFQKLF